MQAQCDGKLNSTSCAKNVDSIQLTCQCNAGFIRRKNVCLQGNSFYIQNLNP